ncbi:MAG: hypothetical protein J6U12_05840 [Candidatus Methanomethylophilaceae archaeon]|nr:hypothetical protein [Candidatus Methanomethylophilaceae archaeon]
MLNRILFQSRLSECMDERASVENALKAYAEGFDYSRKSVDIATEVHCASY